MKKIQLFTILLFPLLVNAQIFIKGIIVDSNGVAIPDVNVYYKNNKKTGTITDTNGYFRIQFVNDTLLCSHLLYKTRKIQPIKTNALITVKLKPKSFLLNEATVSSEKQQLVIKNPWIIDYEITKKYLFIAYVSNKGPMIEIRDFNNNILYQENSKEFIAFEKDCIGNIYLHIAENYFLIDFKSFYYKIINTYNETEFNKIKYSCDVKIKEYQFYNYFLNEKYNLIFNYNIVTKDYLLLNVIADEKDIHYLKELEKENLKKIKSLDDINNKINNLKVLENKDNLINTLEYDAYRLQNEINTDLLFKQFVQKKKINSPIFNVNDTLYIFDNVNNEIVKYLFNGTFLQKTSFTPPFLSPVFIVQDIIKSDVFYFYKLKNKIKVYKYISTGNLFEYITTIRKNIENPKIINGKLFFIEYDKNSQTKLLKTQWLN